MCPSSRKYRGDGLRDVTYGGPAILYRGVDDYFRVLPHASRCTMISGRLALNRGHERTSRWMPNEGESVFPATDNRKFIPSIMLDSPPLFRLRSRLFFGYAKAHLCDFAMKKIAAFGVPCVKATAKSADFSSSLAQQCDPILSPRESSCARSHVFRTKVRSSIPSPPDAADGLRYSHFLLVTKRYSPATSADNEHSVASKRGSFLAAYACR